MDKSRTEACALIGEWIHSEKDRHILTRHMLDGVTYEQIAEEMDLSVDCVKKRGRKATTRLMEHM